MKRLTRVYDCEIPKRIAVTKEKSPQTWRENTAVGKALLRLAAYEDTGLEPEEIKEREAAYMEIMTRTYGPFHQKISQWLQAEKAGRLVVLPCRVGTPVWEIGDFDGGNLKRRPFSVEDMSYWRFGITVFLTREEAEAALKKREEADVCEPESL